LGLFLFELTSVLLFPAIRDASPDKMTLMIAKAKAHALLDKFKDQKVILICSDQVILCNGVVREKPIDVEQAREFLNSYSTYPATAVDGIVVINTATGKTIEHVERATQHFKTLPAEFIEGMIKQGDVMWCAGGFTVEHMTEFLGELEGEQSTIEGLPQTAILRLVTEALSNSDNTMSSS
jgi:septum formation protein